ncbi:MAG: MarR family transcriptional regulator [Verrucomicrobia bacterium]|nr:MarR family transcriptional regulator [Verrucomicrobiota bacterium]
MTKRRLPPLLRRAWFSLNQAFRQRLAPLGITPDQFTILRWIIEADPQGLTQVEITDCMASDPNTITATVRRMESAGLLERVPHESDGRSKRVRALPRGRKVFAEGSLLALDLQGRVLGCLSAREAETFLELLERVSEACAQSGLAVGKRSSGA